MNFSVNRKTPRTQSASTTREVEETVAQHEEQSEKGREQGQVEQTEQVQCQTEEEKEAQSRVSTK